MYAIYVPCGLKTVLWLSAHGDLNWGHHANNLVDIFCVRWLTIISNQHLSGVDEDVYVVVSGGDVDKERLCVLDFRVVIDIYADCLDTIPKNFQHLNFSLIIGRSCTVDAVWINVIQCHVCNQVTSGESVTESKSGVEVKHQKILPIYNLKKKTSHQIN